MYLPIIVVLLFIGVCAGGVDTLLKPLFFVPPTSSYKTYHLIRQANKLQKDTSCVSTSTSSAKASDSNLDEDSPYTTDEYGRPTGVKEGKLQLQTPHSGRKFQPTHPSSFTSSRIRSRIRSRIGSLLMPWKRSKESFINSSKKANRKFLSRNNRRFTEGWYYRLTLPEFNESFVFIFSIEDAGRHTKGKKSPLTLACMQMLGPDDTYLVQSDEDDTKFWGWKDTTALGCTFDWKKEYINKSNEGSMKYIAAMDPTEWREKVESGFQILPFHFNGRLNGHDGSLGGVKANQGILGSASYDFDVRPVAGWGNYPPLSSHNTTDISTQDNKNYKQRSTAGWLASYPVFEPHWQITMANARASGILNWNGTTYEFSDAPFYGEKNWGGAFPIKWYWAQCNSFDDHPDLAFTAGGGIRQLPFSFLPGKRTETLGLIGIHYEGRFYEIVPWTGEMEWEVDPWGRWEFNGKCTDAKQERQFEAKIIAVTDETVSGVKLRAPTKDQGMVRMSVVYDMYIIYVNMSMLMLFL